MSPLIFLLLLIPLFSLYKSFFLKKTNLPPSPASLPFIGHLHLLNSSLPHRSLHSLSLHYGRADSSQIILLNLPSPTLVVSTASAAELVLKTHDIAFASRPASFSEGLKCLSILRKAIARCLFNYYVTADSNMIVKMDLDLIKLSRIKWPVG
jgi:hypothetical protein